MADDFISHKDEVQDDFLEQIQMALNAMGLDASSTASQVCPVDTGMLKASITYATKSHCNTFHTASYKKGKVTTAIGNVDSDYDCYIGTNVEYAPFQEYGTSTGVPAKHFLQYGASAHASEYQKLLERFLKGE